MYLYIISSHRQVDYSMQNLNTWPMPIVIVVNCSQLTVVKRNSGIFDFSIFFHRQAETCRQLKLNGTVRNGRGWGGVGWGWGWKGDKRLKFCQ